MDSILILSTIFLLVIIFYFKQKLLPVVFLWLAIWSLNLIITALLVSSKNYNFNYSLLLAAGYTALYILIFILNIGPLKRIFKKNKTLTILFRQRRNLGVSMFVLSVLHYLLNWSSNFNWDIDAFLFQTEIDADFRLGTSAGMISFVVFVILALISNQKSIKTLGRKTWKKIQLLAYPALLALAIHVATVGVLFDTYFWLRVLTYSLITLTILLKIYDVLLRDFKSKST